MIKNRFSSVEETNEFINYLCSLTHVINITESFSSQLFSVELAFKNHNALRDFQLKILSDFSKIIKQVSILDYYDAPKYNNMSDFLKSINSQRQ